MARAFDLVDSTTVRAIVARVNPTTTVTTTRRRRADGERTHAAILEIATRVASVEGIHGLTIGRLAEELGVSKSGLYAHFGSKQQLQFETIEHARRIVQKEVIEPGFVAAEGLPRLESLCEAFFSYVERHVFPGGCFFAALSAEVAAHTGPIHDAIASDHRGWLDMLEDLGRQAQQHGEIAADVDVKQLAFELDAYLELANYTFILFRDTDALRRGREAVRTALERARAGGQAMRSTSKR